MLYAGFWKRCAAFLIDVIILSVIAWISQAFVGESLGPLVSIVVAWLYYAGLESSPEQATFGKLALNIKVTDMEGNRIGFGTASGRHFAKIISGVILFIGYIMVAFTKKKQGLHDIIAGCLVVNR